MHRFLSPKAIGLGLVALVLISAMTLLGLWQFRVYDDHQRSNAEAALRRPPVDLDTLLGPDDAFPADGVGRPVRVQGHYLPAQQVYVTGLPGSRDRYAVATPMLTATGSAVLVVRGSSPTLGVAVPAGPASIVGVLEPSTASSGPVSPDRVVSGLSVAGLVNAVRPDLYSGYVLLRSSSSQPTSGLTPVSPQLPDPSRWSGARNLVYACQWWIFALFVAFMWWRMTKDIESRDRSRRGPGSRAAAAPVDVRS